MKKLFFILSLLSVLGTEAQVKQASQPVARPAVATGLKTNIAVSTPNPQLTGATLKINTGSVGLNATSQFWIYLIDNNPNEKISSFSFEPPVTGGNNPTSFPANSQQTISLSVQNTDPQNLTGGNAAGFVFPSGTQGVGPGTAAGGILFDYHSVPYNLNPTWKINSMVLTLYFQGGITKTITWNNISTTSSSGNVETYLLFDQNFNPGTNLSFLVSGANHPGHH